MGFLRYDSTSPPIGIEDSELAHLKVVIGTKLRRQESFMMTWSPPGREPARMCSVWVHPAIPLQFLFDSESIPRVDAAHITQLAERVNATGDLVITHITD